MLHKVRLGKLEQNWSSKGPVLVMTNLEFRVLGKGFEQSEPVLEGGKKRVTFHGAVHESEV
jgi:hypothetical protein